MIELRDPKNQRTIFSIIVLGVIGYLFFANTWFPWSYKAHASEIKTLEEEYQGLAREVTQAQQAARRLKLLQEEYETLARHWETAKCFLPEEREIVSLLREITIAGQSAGVEFVHVLPKSPVPQLYVTEHPIEIRVMGGFHQMGTFLGELSALDRLVTITLVKIEAIDNQSEETSMEATFTSSAFTLGGMDPKTVEANKNDKGVKGKIQQVQQKLTGRQGDSQHGSPSEE
ncbi:MAG: type 4a pilus biogenesis protein PilO [Candidatus Eisenbacteria bacterium]|uniref:Type 4a pilus biogenesis protein PilO n=1 Tax=Eiseniibacteriota bacterium TaxID=2212470 RepID=A0A948WD25_UNCEI|nr:type 4a pilus biogenesis protein PilO [Candidatus Eisenbacteria bacterium]MBU1948017.1 type 4a pilus biogenesis protein PilO [Candidatus Eisenbacteria bacterium]MBU2691448.1 type 4a pilus biogenesis protein PilO [Candidatus Eisenbacteria bacterium]